MSSANTDKFLEWAFDSSGRNPLAWRASADDLLVAAAAVKTKVVNVGPMMHSLSAVYAMLLGMAIECMLKGVYIKADNRLTADGKLLDGVGKSHELVQIADAAEYQIDEDERRVLTKLSAFVLFAGRYPIPTKWRQVKPTGGVSPKFISQEDIEIAERVAERLQNAVLPWQQEDVAQ